MTESGEALRCKATKGRCPYASDKHFTSQVQARVAFELLQESFTPRASRSIAHQMALSSETASLLEKLYSNGLMPYVVGGSVRDSLLSGEIPKDIDIEVFQADSMNQLESLLVSAGYRVDSVGKSFGVLTMQLPGGDDIDISLPRIDSKSGDGHRGFDVTVDPTLSMEDAAGRRDFTINALYYSHREGVVKDPHGGLEDYRKGQLRHINEHFSEDPLRVIRGAQFAARFKMELSPETAKLCKSLRKEFHTLPQSRLQTEFDKMFSKGDVSYGLAALKQTGWDTDLKLSELPDNAGNEANMSVARAKSFEEDRTLFGVAKLLELSSEQNRAFVADYAITGVKSQRKALALADVKGPASLNPKEVKAWARGLGKSGLTAKDYYISSGDDKAREAAVKAGSFESPIADILTGAKILEESERKPGPWMGKLLKEAAQAQDEEFFTTESEAKKWLAEKLKGL